MIGRQDRWQEDLFVAGPLSDLIPDDHPLKRIDRVLDLSWFREEVRDLYCLDNGRPGIDPEAAVRLMLAGLVQGIVHDRKLLREWQVNLAIRWFCGYRLHEKLPEHSSLTRIRQRWGAERFGRIFLRTVRQCVTAGLVAGEVIHVDATLLRADVSWESLTVRHVEQVLAENCEGSGPDDDPPVKKPGGPRPKKYSLTDPDATMATSSRQYRLEPSYKQHTAVDDKAGVIVDVAVTTGEVSEGKELLKQIDRVEANTGREVSTVTADAGYGHPANYKELLRRDIVEVIVPPKARAGKRIATSRFKYDALHERVCCPGGKVLLSAAQAKNGRWYRARTQDCRRCRFRSRCFSPRENRRSVLIVDGYVALTAARRAHARGEPERRRLYNRHRGLVEGIHGEGKTQHGLRRAARRGLWNVSIQAYLTAAVMNLKRLAALCLHIWSVVPPEMGLRGPVLRLPSRRDPNPPIHITLTRPEV
ncbi:MAG: IS1182 family transposase [Phycisphaerae bacterium]|jgi:transposase|nr:IS1182 family transposase [Phycisphaerae bacterium]